MPHIHGTWEHLHGVPFFAFGFAQNLPCLCSLSWPQSSGTCLYPVLSLITLMVPAPSSWFSSSLFCVFCLVSSGLSTLSINNLGNCLLLLKSILLLLLSAGPRPKNRCDGAQMKQAKGNESRGKQVLHSSPPYEFRGGCPKPKKGEHQVPAEIPSFSKLSSVRVVALVLEVSLNAGAPRGPCALQDKAPERQTGLTRWETQRSGPRQPFASQKLPRTEVLVQSCGSKGLFEPPAMPPSHC